MRGTALTVKMVAAKRGLKLEWHGRGDTLVRVSGNSDCHIFW